MVKLLSPTNGQQASSFDRRAESKPAAVPETLIKDVVKLCKLLADETRLRILYYLTQSHELHVRALCELLGESQPAVSHHLALLRHGGIIAPRRQGKNNFYSLTETGTGLAHVVKNLIA